MATHTSLGVANPRKFTQQGGHPLDTFYGITQKDTHEKDTVGPSNKGSPPGIQPGQSGFYQGFVLSQAQQRTGSNTKSTRGKRYKLNEKKSSQGETQNELGKMKEESSGRGALNYGELCGRAQRQINVHERGPAETRT